MLILYHIFPPLFCSDAYIVAPVCSMFIWQVNNGPEQPRKQQRSDLNVPLENNNVPEVRCC